MSEMSFEQMLNESFKTIHTGEVVEGTVFSVKPDEIILNIGCKMECDSTHFIQTLDDLYLDLPKSVSLVGITAGASTPNNIIEEVQNYVRNEF